MYDITIIEGNNLSAFFTTDYIREHGIYRLRIWQAKDGSAVKVKINEGMWTPAIGKKDGGLDA